MSAQLREGLSPDQHLTPAAHALHTNMNLYCNCNETAERQGLYFLHINKNKG